MYELTYIISQNLSERDVIAFNQQVKDFVVEKEGQIKKEKIGKKEKLAYSIKKNDFGYYITLELILKADHIKELEKKIKSESGIVRYLIIKIERKPKLAKILQTKTEKAVFTTPDLKEIKKPALSQKKKKVKIEELNKKLEEILKE